MSTTRCCPSLSVDHGQHEAAEALLSRDATCVTGSDFLIDGGVTASYFYGDSPPDTDSTEMNR